jgi:hypothetical protein
MPLKLAADDPLLEKIIDGEIDALTVKSPIVFPEIVPDPFKKLIPADIDEVVVEENEMFFIVLLEIVEDANALVFI